MPASVFFFPRFYIVITLLFIWQDLDDVCYENKWILPTYHVSLLDGKIKFNANGEQYIFQFFINVLNYG